MGNSTYASPDGLGPAADGAETAAIAALRRTRRPPRLAALMEYAPVLDYPLEFNCTSGGTRYHLTCVRREPWHRWWSGVEMPAGVAAASDEAGRGVPGPTTCRPEVPRRGGAGGDDGAAAKRRRHEEGCLLARAAKAADERSMSDTEAWRDDEENAPRVGRTY
jgi:hypothetical protein